MDYTGERNPRDFEHSASARAANPLCRPLQSGGGFVTVAIKKEAHHQAQADLDDAMAKRFTQFQRENLERTDQAVQLLALRGLVAGKMCQIVTDVRADQRKVIEPLRGRRRPRIDES